MRRLFTSESVTEGHPDKVADLISDTILDRLISQNPNAHVAIETLIANGEVVLAGETDADEADILPNDLGELVNAVLAGIGYDTEYRVTSLIHGQSADIAQGVNESVYAGDDEDPLERQGAGDQGLMFGYACDETAALMPLPIAMAHQLAERLAEVRRGGIEWLRPDGKTQVTILYDEAGRPAGVDTIVVSCQHSDDVDDETITKVIADEVVFAVAPHFHLGPASGFDILVNPTGRFVLGGPDADAGLTGRKIIVDSYGGMARHGGGAFSGKDPSKVDRSAAYAARWVAKNVVAAGLADRCELQLAYAIGVAEPISAHLDCFGTEKVLLADIADAIGHVFDLRPAAIARDLDLLQPIYAQTTNYGHFGRDGFAWETTNRASQLARAVHG